jgi:RimJ/RimL family protein N-acetyltransferase
MNDNWHGHKVRLRAVEPEDWQYFLSWSSDAAQQRAVDRLYPPQSAAMTQQYAEEQARHRFADSNGSFRWIIEDLSGQAVGCVVTFDCNPRVGTLKYGISISEARRGEGLGSEAVALVLRYYFQELNYQKANAPIYSFNDGSIRFHERLGFQCEGRLRRMVYTGGEYFDELQYGITREEFAATPCFRALPVV